MFTKEHYKAIAEIIREAKDDYVGGISFELIFMIIEEKFVDYFE